jgi:hypothetical protein
MTQLHVSDAKDVAESVAEHAGDVVHDLTDRVRAVREAHAPEAKVDASPARSRQGLAWMFVALFVTGFAVLVVWRSRRSAASQSPPATNLGPEVGTDSDIPGPAYDPVASTS